MAADLALSLERERQLTRRLVELREETRRDLARELHDTFGQAVTAIRVTAAFLERHAQTLGPEAIRECAGDIQASAGEMTQQMLGLLRELRSEGLGGSALGPSVADLIERWQRRLPDMEFRAELPDAWPLLSAAVELVLFRTLQEGLTNIARHARARRVWVRIATAKEEIHLTLDDDGCGRAAQVARNLGGGLLGMHERAAIAGGRVTLEDSPRGGLRVRLQLPSHCERT